MAVQLWENVLIHVSSKVHGRHLTRVKRYYLTATYTHTYRDNVKAFHDTVCFWCFLPVAVLEREASLCTRGEWSVFINHIDWSYHQPFYRGLLKTNGDKRISVWRWSVMTANLTSSFRMEARACMSTGVPAPIQRSRCFFVDQQHPSRRTHSWTCCKHHSHACFQPSPTAAECTPILLHHTCLESNRYSQPPQLVLFHWSEFSISHSTDSHASASGGSSHPLEVQVFCSISVWLQAHTQPPLLASPVTRHLMRKV